jgi:hypothetical protein
LPVHQYWQLTTGNYFISTMPQTLDYESPKSGTKPKTMDWATWSIRAFIIVGLMVLALLVVVPGIMWHNSFGRVIKKDYTAQESAREFTRYALMMDVLETKSETYQDVFDSVMTRTTGIRGFMHNSFGGAEMWIEVHVTNDLAAEFRDKLSKSPKFTVENVNYIHYPRSSPKWWPKTWLADMRCYKNGSAYFFISDSSNRVWFFWS